MAKILCSKIVNCRLVKFYCHIAIAVTANPVMHEQWNDGFIASVFSYCAVP